MSVVVLLGQLNFEKIAFAAWPNDKLIVTDVLDDDIRAILHLLSDEKKRTSIKAFVTSTGNTHLKAAILRQMLHDLGLEIPVYAGTATNLTTHATTFFAGNFDLEGRHVLTDEVRIELKKMNGVSGDGAEQIANLLAQHSKDKPLDVLCITAPVDLVKAIRMSEGQSQAALGDLFTMGFYRELPNGSFGTPFNSIAGPESVVELFDIFQKGIFRNFYHVPTDTVQLRASLAGGYFPETSEGQLLRSKIQNIMGDRAGLQKPLKAAQEYGLSWWATAGQQFGLGLFSETRWVTGTLKDPAEAGGFYIADHLPAVLSSMTQAELGELDIRARPMTAVRGATAEVPLVIKSTLGHSGTEMRPVSDLFQIDGMGILRQHLDQLERIKIEPLSQPLVHVNLSQAAVVGSKIVKSKQARALVLTFKNSPDDWIAILQIISTQEGRTALERGGVIAEGFDVEKMATSIKGVLNDFGVTGIKVACGMEYKSDEISKFPNFKGEIALRDFAEGQKAFQSISSAASGAHVSKDTIFNSAFEWAQATGGKVDMMFLGEGIDSTQYLSSHPQQFAHLGATYVMGGGRIEPNGQIKFTRNWLVNRQALFDGLEKMGQHGDGVFVFSTSEFGSTLVGVQGQELGNGSVALSVLNENASSKPSLRAIVDHWTNWSRMFDWVIKNDGTAFSPEKPIKTLVVSSLGLHMANAWVTDAISERQNRWTYQAVSLQEIQRDLVIKTSQSPTGISWIRSNGDTGIEAVTHLFRDSLLENLKHPQQLGVGSTLKPINCLGGLAVLLSFPSLKDSQSN